MITDSKKQEEIINKVNNQIFTNLENFEGTWQSFMLHAFNQFGISSKKHYNGMNAFALSTAFKSNLWFTFNEARKYKGAIKKGEKGFLICYWCKTFFVEDLTKKSGIKAVYKLSDLKKEDNVLFVKKGLKKFYVWNEEQIDFKEGIEELEQYKIEFTHKTKPIEEVEEFLHSYTELPRIQHREPRAYYSYGSDFINLPSKDFYKTATAYYGTLFHEIGHSTADKNRLNRKVTGDKRTQRYAQEELIAELTSAYLNNCFGIDSIVNDKAYIKGWLSKLNNQKKAIIKAIEEGVKAYNFIIRNSNLSQELKQAA